MKLLLSNMKTDYTSAQSLLRQAYQQSSGIFNYENQAQLERTFTKQQANQKRPLSSIAAHPSETISVTSIFFNRYREYRKNNVYAFTGLTWLNFLDLPRDHCDSIISWTNAELREKSTEDEKREREILQQMGNTGR